MPQHLSAKALMAAAMLTLWFHGVRSQPPLLAPLAGSGEGPPEPWTLVKLPSQTKPVTRFEIATIDGGPALRIEADKSYGTLVHAMRPEAPQGRVLAWRWRVDQPIAQADLRERSGDDTAVKVCALYDEPMDKISVLDRVWLKTARSARGGDVPSASICYVWDPRLAVGTTLPNAFTGRVRYIVLRSGDSPLSTWVQEKRDLDADFLRLFGEEIDHVPRLVAIAIGGDADNTRSRSLAFVADLVLSP